MKLKSWLKNIISKEPLKVIIYYYKNISILFFHAVSLMEKLSKPLLRTWKWFYFKILQIYLNYLSFSLCPPTPKAQQLKKEYKTLSQGSVQSVQFRCSVVSDSLRPHESQHARPPCPSPTPRVHQNPHPSSRWCHPAISSSASPSLLPPIPRSIRVFSNESTLHIRWPKYWSFSFSFIPSKNTQDWSPLEWTGWISLQSKGL